MDKPDSTSNLHKTSQNSLRVVTHDLNNLLNNVLSSVELLKESVNKDLNLQNLATHIEHNTLLASEIIQQLSSKNKNIQNDKSRLNIRNVILDAIKIFEKKSKNKISIKFHEPDDNYFILGSPTDIKRILLNLITNAEEAGFGNTAIQISVESKSDKIFGESECVNISVSDNGPGIPEKSLNEIFRKGYSTKNQSSVSGLGLSIVKDIMNDHSGYVEVSSQINKGTTFELFFPTSKSINDFKKMENKKVIIAEDDKFQREVLKDLLTSMKLNVFTASDGVEALDLFISTKPDILFIDENMPGMTGLQCTEKIRAIDKSSQIVLVTGSSLDSNFIEEKVTRVLRKPYNFEMVKSTLKDLL